eukprot:TRINITY_DN2849_c0_g2_i1.p1 TRINITY_DN2849_c0_g2~~TRINITY_DN2849_c0_g2_i1.p1  ORF type:complete len:542 (+),score=184.81 TRINITY_DN2849_c0_g2_i1:13-1638(+)
MTTATRLSREDYKKQKEIEEGRKAGTIAPETDEDGKDINPHIPQYIRDAPWYLHKDTPGLKHQRSFLPKVEGTQDWYKRGQRAGDNPLKFRKGACTNCGAMTHQAKDCCERPRKLGAKWTGKDLQADEIVTDLALDFDGKRDRWNGYDSGMHLKVVEQYMKINEERKKKRSQGAVDEKKTEDDEEDDDDDDDENKDYKEDGSASAAGQKMDANTRTTIRNLRIREDTAKYLRNLDLNSAHYDPKTRSMRDNPNPNANPDEVGFRGDNAVRSSGQVKDFAKLQMFAWEAEERGQEDVHIQAAPSLAEYMHQQFKQKKEQQKEKQRDALIQKYGGEEHLNAPDKRLIFAQTDQFVEYSRVDGKVLKGQEKFVAKSKYDEDVFINNHTSVWGSYWENGQWGFACCKQLVKNSYCTGAAGRAAKENALKELLAKSIPPSSLENGNNNGTTTTDDSKSKSTSKSHDKKQKKGKKSKKSSRRRSDSSDDSSSSESSSSSSEDEKESGNKRKYNSMKDCSVTDQEMEEYHRKRLHREDPMAHFASSSP